MPAAVAVVDEHRALGLPGQIQLAVPKLVLADVDQLAASREAADIRYQRALPNPVRGDDLAVAIAALHREFE